MRGARSVESRLLRVLLAPVDARAVCRALGALALCAAMAAACASAREPVARATPPPPAPRPALETAFDPEGLEPLAARLGLSLQRAAFAGPDRLSARRGDERLELAGSPVAGVAVPGAALGWTVVEFRDEPRLRTVKLERAAPRPTPRVACTGQDAIGQLSRLCRERALDLAPRRTAGRRACSDAGSGPQPELWEYTVELAGTATLAHLSGLVRDLDRLGCWALARELVIEESEGERFRTRLVLELVCLNTPADGAPADSRPDRGSPDR